MITKRASILALAPAIAAMSVPALAGHPTNIIEKHPTVTAAAAAIATRHLLKKKAAYDKLHHKKLTFAELHPTMSAVAVGVVVHHEIKKHTPK